MKRIRQFISVNYKVLSGSVAGAIIGYLYWYNYGCYWGLYPMSAECWCNCLLGTLCGGFIASLMNDKEGV